MILWRTNGNYARNLVYFKGFTGTKMFVNVLVVLVKTQKEGKVQVELNSVNVDLYSRITL